MSTFFDGEGNQFKATMAYLSNSSGKERAQRRIIQGITTKGMLKFRDARANIKQISLLEIVVKGKEWVSIQFRNIPL